MEAQRGREALRFIVNALESSAKSRSEHVVGASLLRNRGSEFASRASATRRVNATFSKRWLPYVCDAELRYVPIVKMHPERLAGEEKIAMFCPGYVSPSGSGEIPAYILPEGNRDNDVPVVVAVSTTRKR